MRRTAGRRPQSGAVAVLAAIAAGAGLIALALAIDVGRLYAAQRDLQRVANFAALDAARVSGGCMGVPQDPPAAAYEEALASILRNGGRDSAITPVRVELGQDSLGPDGRHYFDTAQPGSNHAVQVAVTRPAPLRLMPLASPAGDLVAVAAARSRPYASVHVGSRLLELEPEGLNRFLERAFGAGAGSLNVSAVGYTSLLEASVPLDSVVDTLAPVDRLRFRDETVAGMLRDLAETLADAGNDAAATAAEQIAAVADGTQRLAPDEVIAVEREAAKLVGSALIGVGELTVLAAQATSDSAAIELLYTLPPPLGDSSTQVRFIDPGKVAVITPELPGDAEEPGYASNAQAVLMAEVVPDTPLLGSAIRLPIWVQAAQASAEVTDIQCARSGHPQDVVTVDARASVSRLGIGEFKDINAPEPQAQPATLFDGQVAAGLLGIPVPLHVRITAFAAVDLPSDRDELVFTGPFPKTQTIGGPDTVALFDALAQVPSRLDLEIQIAPIGSDGGVLDALDATTRALVENARAPLEAALRAEIAQLLVLAGDQVVARALRETGLTLGGADVKVEDVAAQEPYLFTR